MATPRRKVPSVAAASERFAASSSSTPRPTSFASQYRSPANASFRPEARKRLERDDPASTRSKTGWNSTSMSLGAAATGRLSAGCRHCAERIADDRSRRTGFLRVDPSTSPIASSIEITEHAQVDDYDALQTALAPLRERGAQLAIGRCSAPAFANLRHILRLAPDLVKLDLSLTQEISRDPAREALRGRRSSALPTGVGSLDRPPRGSRVTRDSPSFARSASITARAFHLARPSALLH